MFGQGQCMHVALRLLSAPLCFISAPSRAVQYFGVDAASKQSHSPPESHNSNCGSGDEGDGSDNASSRSGSGSLEVSEAARQIASAMCAAQQLPGEPPQQVGAHWGRGVGRPGMAGAMCFATPVFQLLHHFPVLLCLHCPMH